MKRTKEEIADELSIYNDQVFLSRELFWLSKKDAIEAMQTYADQENAELKEAAVLSADAIGLLQYENADLKAEIASLRSRLDECRRKQIMG